MEQRHHLGFCHWTLAQMTHCDAQSLRRLSPVLGYLSRISLAALMMPFSVCTGDISHLICHSEKCWMDRLCRRTKTSGHLSDNCCGNARPEWLGAYTRMSTSTRKGSAGIVWN